MLGFYLTVKVIPVVMTYTLRKGLCGFDINKRGTPAGDQPVCVCPLTFLTHALNHQLCMTASTSTCSNLPPPPYGWHVWL